MSTPEKSEDPLMAQVRPREETRGRLSRERVLRAAIGLADSEGIESLTMRRLAQELGVEAMSLYHHVTNKDEILNGIADLVVSEIELPATGGDWKAALRRTALSAHHVLLAHRWAANLVLSSTTESPTRLRYMESILGTLRQAGFSAAMTDHAYHALESHIMGFTLWLVGMDLPEREDFAALAKGFVERLPRDEMPYLVEHVEQHLRERRPDEDFTFGLDLILDGLERLLNES